MNILFVMRHAGYVRNFEWALRLLAERGHRVHVAFDEPSRAWMLEPAAVLAGLADRYPNVSYGAALGRDLDPWSILARRLRLAIDYLRYLEPGYRDARKLRARAARRAPRIVRRVAGWPVVRAPFGLALLRRGLQVIEQAVSDARASARFIGRHRPDILLLTPLVELGSPQTDYVRGAKARGVRTGLCVASWDNLTNKGLIRDVPDLIMVWNDAMKREAVELHGVLAERVVVTGAVPYDHWFEWRPSTSREEFCGRVGLRPDRPFVLYLCSSPFIAPEEAGFVGGWIRELRERGGPRLRDAGVLVRPHPINAAQWRDVDLSEPGRVAVWPRVGSDPVDAQSRSDYYDSIYHSVAVVGVNTSAQIESAIVGRPVYTLLAREFRDTQGGTLHFSHLAQAEGGLLRVAETFEEHAAQLAEALVADARADERTRQFVEAFVRPWGLDVAATPRLVEAIEVACAAPAPRPRLRPRWAALLHLLLTPLVYGGHWGREAYLRRARRRARPLLRRLKLLRRWTRRPRRWAKLLVRRLKLLPRWARQILRRAKRLLKSARPCLRWGRLLLRRARSLMRRTTLVGRRATPPARAANRCLRRAALAGIRRSLRVGPVRRFAGRRVLPALETAAAKLGDGHLASLRYGVDKLAREIALVRRDRRLGSAMSERPVTHGALNGHDTSPNRGDVAAPGRGRPPTSLRG